MYEEQTYEKIMNRALQRVPGNIDRREGSVIYDALAPAAVELAQMYAEMDTVLRLGFAETSSGSYLELRTSELGVTRHPAAIAKRKGLFYDRNKSPLDVQAGSRFSIRDVNFIVREKLAAGEFVMECEVSGAKGNEPFGSLIPIDYIPGLARAELADVLIPGEDVESDASLLYRYRIRARQAATSGNEYHYRQWSLEVPGVGDATIFPLWNGPGTVKVVIVDSNKQPASTLLLQAVSEHIEAVRPIGAEITVGSAAAKSVDVAATIIIAEGYTIQNVQEAFAAALTAHLKELVFADSYVSYARIGTILLNIPGVMDYHHLLLNGETSNIVLQDEEIPILGTVNLEV